MALDPRTPVIVGVGQFLHRADGLEDALEPAALMEAAMHACRHPLYSKRYQRNKRRLGKQRGPRVAQVDIARKLAEAIWHMLTRNQPFAPAGARFRLAA